MKKDIRPLSVIEGRSEGTSINCSRQTAMRASSVTVPGNMRYVRFSGNKNARK